MRVQGDEIDEKVQDLWMLSRVWKEFYEGTRVKDTLLGTTTFFPGSTPQLPGFQENHQDYPPEV